MILELLGASYRHSDECQILFRLCITKARRHQMKLAYKKEGGTQNLSSSQPLTFHSQKSHDTFSTMRYHFLIMCLILWGTSLPGFAVYKIVQLDMFQQGQITTSNIELRRFVSEEVLRNRLTCIMVNNPVLPSPHPLNTDSNLAVN